MLKISEKDKRTVKFGAFFAVGILVFLGVMRWIDHWKAVRRASVQESQIVSALDVDGTKEMALRSVVPVLTMPVREEQQKILFRDALNEQLKSTGITSKPLEIMTTGRRQVGQYKKLNVQCAADCRFDQVLQLLAKLNENPYLTAVEEFSIKCDKDNPENVTLKLIVSTLTK